MRPFIKHKIAIFSPQGFIDGNNAPSFITLEDIKFCASREIDAALISLSKVVHFNKNGISSLVQILEEIRGKRAITIGFCDYRLKHFENFKKIFNENIPFCLFDTQKVANLFVGVIQAEVGSKVLLFAKEKTQKNSIAFELHKRGLKAIMAKDEEEFEKIKSEDMDGREFYTYAKMIYIGSFQDKIASNVHGNLIIYNVADYIDNSVNERFDIVFHKNSLNVGFKFFVFECKDVCSVNIHGVNFFSKLSVAAAEYGGTIALCGLKSNAITESFRSELEDAGVLFFSSLEKLLEDKETLEEYSGGAAINKKSSKTLNKTLISKLPIFINSAIYTMKIITNIEPKKSSLKISTLEIEEREEKLLSTSMGFYGDIDGMMVLIFTQNVAKEACKIFLGDEIKSQSELIDGLSEFANIIAGRSKTTLSQQKCNISLTLPRTFENIKDLTKNLEGKKGAFVQLDFGDTPFYLFLTR